MTMAEGQNTRTQQRLHLRALTADDLRSELEEKGGRKALNLHVLAGCGCAVPRWAVIGTDVFDRFAKSAELQETITLALSESNESINSQLQECILEAPVDNVVLGVISEAYELAGSGSVAVRSSGAEEDSSSHSFAGQFDSYLNIRGLEAVVAHVKRCWASAFGERAMLYRQQHKLADRDTSAMGVIVQSLVSATKSGVMFTANAITGCQEEATISSVFGLGQSLVHGAVDADTITVDRASGMLREVHIGEKEEETVPVTDGVGCVTFNVPRERRASLSLDQEEIASLLKVASTIDGAFGSPQDIEWAFEKGALSILQSRPITTEVNSGSPHESRNSTGTLRIWDNSNIIESFGEVNSPLTFTFARHVYHQVHRWYCKSLKVPERLLQQMDEWQANRLAYFNGRVYYNLLNWYRMQHLLPFPGMKRKMMEMAMGLDESLSDEMAKDIRPLPHSSQRTERLVRILVSTVFAWRFIRSGHDVRKFMERFDGSVTDLDALDFEGMSAEELYEQMLALDRELLPTWGPIVAVEAIILTAIGLLFGLTQRWLPDAPRWFYWNVAKPSDGVESAEPARAMVEMASMVEKDRELARILTEVDPKAAYERLANEGKREFLAAVDEYVSRFGYRSADELKLEEPSMRDDVSVFFTLLRGSLVPISRRKEGADRGQDAHDADCYLANHMGRIRRPIYELFRRKAQASLAAREQIRFCRSRGFGLARRMFRALDSELVRMGIIDQAGDVFFLRLEELRGAFEGTIAHDELTGLIALRKEQQLAYQQLTAPSRFVTRGPMYWYGNLNNAGWYGDTPTSTGHTATSDQMQGIGCCPGTVVGEAKVLKTPIDVNGAVIVAYRTDPGWIAALPSATALIVERGSPLTHVAIVARELGVPTVVQVKDLTANVKTGMLLNVNGGDGTVTILSKDAS